MYFHDLNIIYNYLHEGLIYLVKKFNDYYLCFTIIISIITIIFTLFILFESKFYSIKDSYYRTNHLFQSSSSLSFLNWIFKSSNHIKTRFFHEFIHSLNKEFFSREERLSIETIQYDNAKISNVTQTSLETIVINATLDIDRLILNLIKDQQFSIKISKLTGELEVLLNNNIIKVKFKQIQLVDTEIINSHQIFSYDEKQSIIKLFTDVITQTIVQYCLYLSDNQEMTPPVTLPTPPQTMPVAQHFETPIIAPVVTPTINQQIIPHEKQVKKLLVRIVKAVKLHDVEQPFCVLELNNPNQIHQTSIAKNGVNPFWDERFLFECNDKSNAIHLQIIDRRKPTKKMPLHNLDILYADVSIPFSYVTSTIYKQDVRITPRYPDSIIRIEFSTLTEEDELAANHGDDPETPTDSPLCLNTEHETNHIPNNHRSSTSDEILTLASNANTSFKDYHTHNYATTDRFITSTPLASFDDSKNLPKPRKSRSFMNSFRIFSRRKKGKENENENGLISSYNTSTPTNTISPSASAEPFVSKNSSSFHRHGVISESFRNFFRSKSKKTNIDTSNFIVDHPESLGTLTSTSKKRSFFQRFKSKHKHHIGSSRNSLTSNDCTRTESVRNTPVRANVGRPVTMIK